jgi:hypothetical protein
VLKPERQESEMGEGEWESGRVGEWESGRIKPYKRNIFEHINCMDVE